MKKMVKKTLSLCMVVAMMAAMATTAFAEETRAYFTDFEMTSAPYRVTNVIADNATNNISDNLPQWFNKGSASVFSWQTEAVGNVEITKKSVVTLEFPHNGIVLTQLDSSVKMLDDEAFMKIYMDSNPISNVSDYVDIVADKPKSDEFGYENYESGVTVQFKKEGTYLLSVKGIDGQTNDIFDYFAPIIFTVTEDTTTKSQPQTQTQATTNSSKVLVNGTAVEFDAYTINGNNYFKLRDVAKVVSGSDKQFEVSWDGTKSAIDLISNKAYTEVGGELVKGDGTTKNAEDCTSAILKDGAPVTLKAYTINGNNYFKLRDLGEAFNFSVSWDGTNNAVVIDTKASYTAE